MNLRIFAVLATVIFLVIAVPMLLVEPSGSASAGIAAGFMMPLGSIYHVAILVAVGLLAASMGDEAIILLPLCTLLMLVIGGVTQIDPHQFTGIQNIMVVAIILFSLTVSMLRNKLNLVTIPFIGLWAFKASSNYMIDVPNITTPIYFMIGIIVSAFLMTGIGISIGITLTEVIQGITGKFKNLPAITTFLSFF